MKAFTLESSRETVSCPATLFLLVSLLGIGDVNRLTGRHVCQNSSTYITISYWQRNANKSQILKEKLGEVISYVNYTELGHCYCISVCYCFKNSQVIKLTMSGGGIKIKWWIDKMGSIFSEVLRFKGILPLWSNKHVCYGVQSQWTIQDESIYCQS